MRNIIPKGVNCVFARQREALGLGHVVLCAALPTEALWEAHLQPRTSVISISRVAEDEVSKYGIISAGASGLKKIAGIVEKSALDKAPSNLASICRHVFEPEIFDILRGQKNWSRWRNPDR